METKPPAKETPVAAAKPAAVTAPQSATPGLEVRFKTSRKFYPALGDDREVIEFSVELTKFITGSVSAPDAVASQELVELRAAAENLATQHQMEIATEAGVLAKATDLSRELIATQAGLEKAKSKLRETEHLIDNPSQTMTTRDNLARQRDESLTFIRRAEEDIPRLSEALTALPRPVYLKAIDP